MKPLGIVTMVEIQVDSEDLYTNGYTKDPDDVRVVFRLGWSRLTAVWPHYQIGGFLRSNELHTFLQCGAFLGVYRD